MTGSVQASLTRVRTNFSWMGVLTMAALVITGCTKNDGGGPGNVDSLLRQARSCDDVLQSLKDDAVAKVGLEAEAFIDDYYFGGRGVLEGDVAFGAPQPAAPTNDADGGGAEAPSGFSDTNTQVAGVDEADIVKVGDEGRKLFVIRGNSFYEFSSWPAASTVRVADKEIEGFPIEMFVDGDRAVVFSNVFGLEGVDDEDVCGGPFPEPLPLADEAIGPYYCGRSYVKTTVLDLSSDVPTAVREVYVEGYYTSSRRHGEIVRGVVQSNLRQPASIPYLWDFLYQNGEQYPQTREERFAIAEAWSRQAIDAIQLTTLEDWLPVWAEKVDDAIAVQPTQCDGFYSPSAGLTNYGLTQIVGFATSGGAVDIASILGQATHVYANADALTLAQPDWTWSQRRENEDRTALHRFLLSSQSGLSVYVGSGFVPGLVEDQFSIDEQNGVLRVATTRTTWGGPPADPVIDVWIPPVTHNLVTTLALEGDELVIQGQTPPLAEGERIFSARFIGDLAYVVTFRQVDPLFAIDLSDPTSPTVLGELKIPGFSDYMHPLGDGYLLTIGRDVDEATQRDNGLALQIFDVRDPVNPLPAHKELLGQGFSEANHNHKAFNFYDSKGVLAFPFSDYRGTFSSTLEVWDVDAESGFSHRGSVDHSSLLIRDCADWTPGGVPFDADFFYQDCGYSPQVTRGVFIDDFVYSISHGGVLVHGLGDLADPVATATYE